MIPPRPKLRRVHASDRHLCKEHDLIERCFAKITPLRRVMTRDDQLLTKVGSFVSIAGTPLGSNR